MEKPNESQAGSPTEQPFVLPSESLVKLIALAHHAILCDKWMRENVGHTADYPVDIIAEPEEGATCSKMMKAVELASRDVRADGECMRQLMRWQILTFGNPYNDSDIL